MLPELDDEFAKEFGLESLAELKEKIDESYRQQEKKRIEGDLRERLVDALVERNPIEVPEAMVAEPARFHAEESAQPLPVPGDEPGDAGHER